MHISLIAAMDENNLIGSGNQLPWGHIKEDMQWFRKHTEGKPVIMGRKTFTSIGHPLPARTNIILSRDAEFFATDCIVADSPEEAVDWGALYAKDEIMVIGGAAIFAMFLHHADRIYRTRIHAEFAGDVYFPLHGTHVWETKVVQHLDACDKGWTLTFQILERVGVSM